MRKNSNLEPQVNNELTYFCFRKPEPDSKLFHRPELLRLYLQIACHARYTPGPDQGRARVDTLAGWTAKQKSRALRKLARMGFVTLGRDGRAVTATLTEASGVLLYGQEFDWGRGYIRVYRGPQLQTLLESRTRELELEVWLRSRAWYEDEWVWAEFSLRHVPGMSRKQARTALNNLKKNRVVQPRIRAKKVVTKNVTIGTENGHNPKEDKTCVRFLTQALCEGAGEDLIRVKGPASEEKGPSKGPVYKKGVIRKDLIKKENIPSASLPVLFSGLEDGELAQDIDGVSNTRHIDCEPQSNHPESEWVEPLDGEREENQTRAQTRARQDSGKMARSLGLQPRTRIALQSYLELVYDRNPKQDTRFILQDLRGLVHPDTEARIWDWLMERVRTRNRNWDVAELGLYLTRKDQDLSTPPALLSRIQALKPYLDPESRQHWSRDPRPLDRTLAQHLEDRAQHLSRIRDPQDVPPELVCSLMFYARSQGLERVQALIEDLYQSTMKEEGLWLEALDTFLNPAKAA